MCLVRRNQTGGWADDRSPTSTLASRNGGTRSSDHPDTVWLKLGSYSEHVLSDVRYAVVPQRFDRVDRSISFPLLRIGRWFGLSVAPGITMENKQR
jgi:hypothetical protein